jgi:hypothetical protein
LLKNFGMLSVEMWVLMEKFRVLSVDMWVLMEKFWMLSGDLRVLVEKFGMLSRNMCVLVEDSIRIVWQLLMENLWMLSLLEQVMYVVGQLLLKYWMVLGNYGSLHVVLFMRGLWNLGVDVLGNMSVDVCGMYMKWKNGLRSLRYDHWRWWGNGYMMVMVHESSGSILTDDIGVVQWYSRWTYRYLMDEGESWAKRRMYGFDGWCNGYQWGDWLR